MLLLPLTVTGVRPFRALFDFRSPALSRPCSVFTHGRRNTLKRLVVLVSVMVDLLDFRSQAL